MEFDAKLIQHFTASELVEFLDISIDTVLDRFDDEINDRFDDLCEEIGYDGGSESEGSGWSD
jgi:hypothetical protein